MREALTEKEVQDRLNCRAEGAAEALPRIIPPSKLEVALSDEQKHILAIVKLGGNTFFTGPAGTGKSVLLRVIIKELVKIKPLEAIAITATTGIAALAIGGQTLHSYAGIGCGKEVAERLASRIRRSQMLRERWRSTQVWVIDEISMMKAEIFDKLEYIARFIRKSNKPFGGIQLVLTGDFFQLPPIATERYSTPADYVFNANSWEVCIPQPYFLQKVFRQEDNTFVDLLSAVRFGCLNERQIQVLRSLERPLTCATDIQPALLLPRRYGVIWHNNHQLELLQGPSKTYFAIDSAGWDVFRHPVDFKRAKNLLETGTQALEAVKLKVGAQVMLVQNVVQGVLVNGSIGQVTGFLTISEALKRDIMISTPGVSDADDDDREQHDRLDYDNPPTQPPPYEYRSYIEELVLETYRTNPELAGRPTNLRDITSHAVPAHMEWPLVQFSDGRQLLCAPMYFEHKGFLGNIEARRIQVPLILSWAITIHKSQGQTLNFVKVDFENIFANGQAYVALSRATSMEGLQVVNFRPEAVRVDPIVLQWHTTWQEICESERRLLEEVATDLSWIDDVPMEECADDGDIFDLYNVEIPGVAQSNLI